MRVALGASLALHVALAAVLVVVKMPGSQPADETPPTRVTLYVDPARGSPEPAAVTPTPAPAAVTTGTAEAPAFPAAVSTAVTAQPERRIVTSLTPPRAVPRTTAAAATDGDDPARPLATASAPAPRPLTREVVTAPSGLPPPASVLDDFGAERGPDDTPPPRPASDGVPSLDVTRGYGWTPKGLLAIPAFPDVLRREGREAEVTVRFRINAQGAVIEAIVDKTSGDTTVDAAVIAVVRGYLFEPVDDGSIEEDGVVTFHFRLQKGF